MLRSILTTCVSYNSINYSHHVVHSIPNADVVQSLSTVWLCNSMDSSMPGFPVPHQLLEFVQVQVHCIGDAIQPSHPLMPSSVLDISQHQWLFQWVICFHQMIKILELQLQHQSLKWIFRVDPFLIPYLITRSLYITTFFQIPLPLLPTDLSLISVIWYLWPQNQLLTCSVTWFSFLIKNKYG